MSVIANVAINVDARGAAAQLRQFQNQSQATQRAADALTGSTKRVGLTAQQAARQVDASTDAIRRQGQVAQQTSRAVDALGGAVRNTVAAFSLIQAGRFVFAKTAELETQTRSLQVLTGSADKAKQIIKELQQLGAVTPFTSTELIDAAKRLQAFGIEADRVVETTRRLADVSGATGAELQGLVTAYGQVQAKGRLQGEELLQFQERGVALQEVLRKEYKMSGEEFQKALSKGQVSAAAVEYALIKLTETGGKYANGAVAQSDTLTGRLSTLQDGIDEVARKVGALLSPTLLNVINQANQAIGQMPALVDDISLAFQFAYSQMQPFLNGLGQLQWYFTNLTPPGWAMQVISGSVDLGRGIIGRFAGMQRQSQPQVASKMGPELPQRLQRPAATILPPLTSGTAAARVTGAGAVKASKQAPENRTDALMTELRGLIAVGQAQDKIRDLQFQGRDVLAASVELEQELGQIERDRIEALKGANYETERTVVNKIAEAKVTDAKLRTEDKVRDITNQRFQAELQIQQAIRDTIRPFEDIRNAQAEQNQYQQTYLRLVMEGMLPAEAQRIANFDQMIRQQLQAVEQQIDITQGAITEAKARGANVVELQKELDLLKKKRDAIKGEAAKGPGQGPSDTDRLKESIAAVKGQLNELTDPINQIISAASAIGDAFANSFKGLISGSMSAKEALRSFFEATASHFLDMAAQIIAKQIQLFVLQTALSIFGGGSVFGSGGAPNYSGTFGGGAASFNPKAFTPGLKLFAEGGFVTRPTNALIGEAGEAEYVIPASKMRGAMERYAAGARGDSVISGAGGGSTAKTATGGGPLVVEVRAQMERINSVDYVTAEQFQAGIQQAAQQGAAQGEQRTLRRLQHSPATRRRVGV